VPKAEGEPVDFLEDAAYHNVTCPPFGTFGRQLLQRPKSKQITPRNIAMPSANANGTDSRVQKSVLLVLLFSGPYSIIYSSSKLSWAAHPKTAQCPESLILSSFIAIVSCQLQASSEATYQAKVG